MAYEAGCDRVHSVQDPVTGTTAYTYRAGGERASVTLPGGGTWTYLYDSGGFLMGPLNQSGQQGTYTRVVNQNAYAYDNVGQRLVNAVSVQARNADGTPQVDGSGNPVLVTRTEKYEKADGSSGYDALNRLTSVDYGDGQTQSYTFDAMGNRLSRQDSVSGTTTSTYNAANMLLSTTGAGASTYTNDTDGNTLSGNGRTNAWDSQNRLVSGIAVK